MKQIQVGISLLLIVAGWSCTTDDGSKGNEYSRTGHAADKIVEKYAEVELVTDLSVLSEKEKAMLPILMEAADIMDALFWYEAYGDREALFEEVQDSTLRKALEINYGPWDRLDGNKPFVKGVGPKPAGANFYPADMTKEEFEAADLPDKSSLYTFLRRNEEGKLTTVPYHVQFREQVGKAAELLRQAAELAEDPGLKKYLLLRA